MLNSSSCSKECGKKGMALSDYLRSNGSFPLEQLKSFPQLLKNIHCLEVCDWTMCLSIFSIQSAKPLFLLCISYLMISLLLCSFYSVSYTYTWLFCLCSCLLRWVQCWTTLCCFTILTLSKTSPSYWDSITGWVKHYRKVKIDI